jgi:tetratricopeptide (TPR) repeat protein
MHKISKFLPLAILVCSVSIACKSDADPLAGGDSTPASAKTPDSKPDESSKVKFAEEAVVHYNNAVKLHQTGFYNKAIAEYHAALAIDDRMWPAWSNLAGIYLSQQSFVKAIESCEKGLAIIPNESPLLRQYAQVLWSTGRKEQAIEKCRHALDIDPSNSYAAHDLSFMLKETGHPEEAEDVLKKMPKEPQGDFSPGPTKTHLPLKG